MALQGYKAIVKAQSAATVFTTEACSTSDNMTYQITDTAKRIFDYDTAVLVYDSAVLTTEEYTLSRLNGTVTFGSVDAGRVITMSGKYVTLTQIAEAKGFTFDGSADMGDITVFQDTRREFTPLLISGTVSLEQFYMTDNFFLDLWTDKSVKVIEFLPNSSDTDGIYRVFGIVSGDSIASAIDGLVSETVSLQCTDAMITQA